MVRWRPAAWLAAYALSLAGCAPGPRAPADPGVCYNVVNNSAGQSGGVVDGKYRFYVLKRNVADLEHCAAALDGMRIHFLALGGSNHDVTGVYQGEWLFVDQRGVFSSASLQADTFPLLRRTDDGRLVPPSAPDQPSQ
jgi:hypothetical protein